MKKNNFKRAAGLLLATCISQSILAGELPVTFTSQPPSTVKVAYYPAIQAQKTINFTLKNNTPVTQHLHYKTYVSKGKIQKRDDKKACDELPAFQSCSRSFLYTQDAPTIGTSATGYITITYTGSDGHDKQTLTSNTINFLIVPSKPSPFHTSKA